MAARLFSGTAKLEHLREVAKDLQIRELQRRRMESDTRTPPKSSDKPPEYKRPELRRWGSLRELTAGGGGFRNEPVSKLTTRF